MVRGAAFSELVAVDSVNLDFYVQKAINDQDPLLVVLAIDQVTQHKLDKYLPDLTTLMAAGAEIDVDIRRSIVEAAGQFLEDATQDTVAMKLLISGLFDPEYVVRREAVQMYRNKLNEDRSGMIPPANTRISERSIRKGIEGYKNNPRALVTTNRGQFEMELYFDAAPLTVLNFVELVEDGFYDGLSFHRVVPNFVVQGGDPRGDGWGGPPYFIRCEYTDEPYLRGTVGIATSGKDTGGSQFFVTLSPQPHLEGRYTVFGQVTGGMEVVDQIVVGDVIERITVEDE